MRTVVLAPRSRDISWTFAELLRTLPYPIISETWSPHDRARGRHLAVAKERGYDVAVWLDDDTVCTPDDVHLLVSGLVQRPELDLLTGVYCCRHLAEEGRLGLNFNLMAPGGYRIGDLLVGPPPHAWGILPIAACGFGFVAHRVAPLDRIDAPECQYAGALGRAWFLPMVEGDEHLGEDRSFCVRARIAGWRMAVDTRLVVGHRGGKTWKPASVIPR